MTHAERAKRRARVKDDLRAGMRNRDIAKRHGLSEDYIRDIARANNLLHPVGRPRLIQCPDARRRYLNRCKRVGAAQAKIEFGIGA